VLIKENLFENNFDLRIYKLKPKSFWNSKRKLQFKSNQIQKMLSDDKKVLITVDKSSLSIFDNCFINNNGVLILVKQFSSSINFCKKTNFENTEKKTLQSDEKLKKNLFNSKKKDRIKYKEEILETKEKPVSSSNIFKTKTPSYFLRQFNDSSPKKLDPKRIKKKVPSHVLLKKIKSTSTIAKKPSPTNFSYFSILDKQSNCLDSK
jgi:hypothetical protein